MEYNPEKAKEIATKHSISPITLNVWKSRGRIPEKYNTDAAPTRNAETKAEIDEEKRLLAILGNEKLNRRNLCEITEVTYAKVSDALRGKGKLTTDEVLRIKKTINRLRILIKKEVEALLEKRRFTDRDKEAIDNLLKNDLIVIAPIIGYNRTEHKTGDKETTIYKRFDGRLSKRATIFEDWEVLFVVDRFSIFLLETGI